MINTDWKRPGTTDKGREFEHVMITNLSLKLVLDREMKDFKISADDNAFGDFDVSSKNKTLSLASLLGESGNFSLQKYCASYTELGECEPNCQFALLTNVKCKISSGTIVEIKGKHISIKMLLLQPDKLINISPNGRCYKFEVESAGSEQVGEIHKAFFESFFQYTDQRHVNQLKLDVTNKFEQDFERADDVVSKYFEFISNWCKLEGPKEKLNRGFVKNTITMHLLSSNMKSFSCGSVSDNFKILAEAIAKLDVVVIKPKMEDVIKKMWITLIVKGSASVYKSLQLCKHKTIVILDGDSKEETLENSSSFRNFSSLKPFVDMYNKVLENAKWIFLGKPEISLKYLLENIPKLETDITLNVLLLMTDRSCRIGGDKEDLPTQYIDRRFKTQLLNVNNVNSFDENTLIVISCLQQNRGKTNSLVNVKLINFEFVKSDIKKTLDDIDKNYSKSVFSGYLQMNKKEIYIREKQCSAEQFDIICQKFNFEKCYHFKVRTDGLLE